MGGFSGPNIVTDGLITHLDPRSKKSYPGSGTAWTDLTGNGHSAVLQYQGVGTSEIGVMTPAGGTITISSNSVFVGAKTWEVWFKINNFPANSTFDSIWQHANNWNQNTGKGMHLIYGNFTFSYGQTWGGVCQIAISSLSTNTWYNAVGTSDGTTGTDKCKLYLNGDLKDTGTSVNVPSDSTNIQIGYGNGGAIDGVIGCFSVYSKELSAEEVLKNFTTKKSRFGL